MDVAVTVDPELCIGSGDCARALPAAFQVDDARGVAVPLAGAATTEIGALLQAARGCPTQAIRIVRDAQVQHAAE